jgi:hypothetical protein
MVSLAPPPVTVEGAQLEPLPKAAPEPGAEALPSRVRKSRGEPMVPPGAALLSQVEHLLELRFCHLVAIGA